MKKLDWYIFKKFIVTFLFSLMILAIIIIVVDLSEKADDFVKSGLTFRQIIMQYYLGFIPHMIALIFPLFVFISVIFFTSKMAGKSEIVAILASGTSFRRFMFPYWVGAIVLSVSLWLADRYLLPKANRIFSIFQVKYIDGPGNYGPNNQAAAIYFRVDSNRYAQISNFDTATKSGYNFVVQKITNNQLVNNVRADRLEWDTSKQKWKLINAIERKINGLDEDVRQFDTLFMPFNFKPQDIRKDEYTKDKLTTPELSKFIALQQVRGTEGINDLLVERYRRSATPFSVILLTFMGVSIASRKVRGGMGFHLAFGFILAMLFIFTERFSTMFSTKGDFPPLIATWLPNIIFSIVAIYLYRRAPK
ncbi:MAG: LptF/LptG family permease [Chitinophagaceae bacterium]